MREEAQSASPIEIVDRPHAANLVRWAKNRPEVVVLSCDLTASCEADRFRGAYPERFFSLGMAEQNMISFAGGMAREGFTPFVHTFGVFICRRPFDQVAMSIAYPNLPVRLLGFLPGITTPGGVTHQAIDDLALMRALPNMTVLECGDATEVESVLDAMQAIDGPVYVRMLRGKVPRLFPTTRPLIVGQARLLEGEADQGCDIAVISSGICTAEVWPLVSELRRVGIAVSLLHVSTIKPFDDDGLADRVLAARRGVICLENHSVVGGLGSAVAELLATGAAGVPLIRLGLQDTFAHGASCQHLMREYGLDRRALLEAIERLLQRSTGLRLADLDGETHEIAAAEQPDLL